MRFALWFAAVALHRGCAVAAGMPRGFGSAVNSTPGPTNGTFGPPNTPDAPALHERCDVFASGALVHFAIEEALPKTSFRIGVNANCQIVPARIDLTLANLIVTEVIRQVGLLQGRGRHPRVQFGTVERPWKAGGHRSSGGIAFAYSLAHCKNVHLHGYDASGAYEKQPGKKINTFHDMKNEHAKSSARNPGAMPFGINQSSTLSTPSRETAWMDCATHCASCRPPFRDDEAGEALAASLRRRVTEYGATMVATGAAERKEQAASSK
ncbi:hypothetical protein M885DRAFT_502696 [Pelagophyceae sp. CCMP2097]|nr:hypothetical protein M885DRAFT_502696 [Pelagophyceae sp. CCMP2097]